MVTVGVAGLLTVPAQARDLDTLARWMQGSFDSKAQAAASPDYYPITLHMRAIWPDAKDGPWLYVEQAVASKPDKPYRQRVYQLVAEADGGFASRVYTLAEPTAAIGAWQDDARAAALRRDAIELKQGCAVYLAWDYEAKHFAGQTHADDCKSDFRGAAYATSQVTVQGNKVISWDRGFDAKGQYVWGAEKAGYVFDKQP